MDGHPAVTAEHPLAGAGRVYQYFIKVTRVGLCQPLRTFTRNEQIGNPGQLQILYKSFSPGNTNIIGQQKSLSCQARSQLRRLPSGSRTEIQHPVPRNNRKPAGRSHSAGLLKIVKTRIVMRMPGRSASILIIKTILYPGNLFQRTSGNPAKIRRTELHGIHPQAMGRRLLKALQIFAVFISQKFFHCFTITFRQLHLQSVPSYCSSVTL